MKLLYGELVLDGYYTASSSKKEEKNYILSSIFPSQESMELALEQISIDA